VIRDIAIIDGVRTPLCKAGTALRELPAQELGRIAVREVIERTAIDIELIDHVVIGNIGSPAEATNVARVVAVKAGIPERVAAYTVNRNCASGMEAIAEAARLIATGEAQVVVAGGTESMSQLPLLFGDEAKALFIGMSRARSLGQRAALASQFRPRYLAPVVALEQGLTDASCGLNMGETAEVLAKEWKLSREVQDEFALRSHRLAVAARERHSAEIVPIYLPPRFVEVVAEDVGPRAEQSIEALSRLRTVFDRRHGTVTAGNACGITDGAAACLVMSQRRALELGYEPLGRVRAYAVAGLDPERMGLGPAYATPLALDQARVSLRDIQLIELNEAFAAQVLANEAAFASARFAQEKLGRSAATGEIDREILNVNGGAIAIGHPVGATGTRLVLTLLYEMRRRNLNLGLATLCVGGGQGAAMVLER
jgi:acetyl-CoA acetyltransferase family protein